MNRKKLVKRMALAALIVLVVSLIVQASRVMYESRIQARINHERAMRVAQLSNKYQAFLDERAAKINSLNLDRELVSRIKSDILKESSTAEIYLWLSSKEGQFVFGIPEPVFARMNKTYDKYKKVLDKDGYFTDRNDYLSRLVNFHDRLRHSHFDRRGEEPLIRVRDWDYYVDEYYSTRVGIPLHLSSPIMDSENNIIGELNLKVLDKSFRDFYRSLRDENMLNGLLYPGTQFILIVALLFLWLLLPTWVYIDARERDVKNAVRWAVLTVISFGFASLIYLITRPQAPVDFHCPECEKELNGTKAFCPFCGFDLSHTFCPQCQYPLNPKWKFCPSCRFDVAGEEEQQEPLASHE